MRIRLRVAGAVVLGLVAICAALVTAASVSRSDKPLLVFAERDTPTYEPITILQDGAAFHRVVLHSGAREVALGVRSYPNPAAVSAEDWLRATWDSAHLIRTREIQTSAGRGIAVVDPRAWLDAQNGETDFPVVAVLRVGPRIVVVDRLNGTQIDAQLALQILADSTAP